MEDEAGFLGEHFEHISSASYYNLTFLKFKERAERQRLGQKCTKGEPYNRALNVAELKAAVCACNNSAPGGDLIMYKMIKNLHPEALNALLSLYNTM